MMMMMMMMIMMMMMMVAMEVVAVMMIIMMMTTMMMMIMDANLMIVRVIATTTEMNLSGTDACWRLASQNLTRAGPSDGPSSRNSHPSSWRMGWIRLISGSRRIKDRCGKPPIAHTMQNLLPQCASLLETFSVSVDTPLTLSVQNT